jgi:MFS family permease
MKDNSAGESRFSQAFAALTYGAYRRFAVSLLLTSLGAQLLQTAILWQVFELTGSALLLGLTGLARAGPHVLLSLIGGVAADRVNRVRLIQSGQVVNGVLVFVLAGLTLAGSVEVWHLYVMTVLNGAFTALTQPARTALIPWLIPRERLVNAIALNATISQTSQIAGPALAGVAIGVVGLGPVYMVNGVFYLLAMIAIIAIRVPAAPIEGRESPWQSLLDGLSFVKRKPVIISLLVIDLGETVLGSYRALLPIFATNLGVGAGGYGVLSAAPGIGSLMGTLFIMSLGDMRYKGLFTIFGVLAYCVALVLLALTPWFWLALVAAALLGATNSIQVVPRNSAIIAISPDALRGRVESFRGMLAGGGPPLGYTLSGVLAAALGPAMALVAGAIACAALVTGVGITRKELRDPDLGSSRSVIPARAEDGRESAAEGRPV